MKKKAISDLEDAHEEAMNELREKQEAEMQVLKTAQEKERKEKHFDPKLVAAANAREVEISKVLRNIEILKGTNL